MVHGSFYRRHGAAILLVAALLVPVIAWGVHRAIRSNSNDVRDWLPTQYAETQQYRWFTEHFGVQDFIIASWPGCTLTDTRLDEFATALADLSGREADFRPFAEILTGRSLIERLTEPPLELDEDLAIQRLQGSIVGPDGEQTCAVMTLTEAATSRLEPTLGLIAQAAAAAGIAPNELRIGGIPVINAALNRESTASLVRLAGLSGVLGMLVAWLCFRDLRLTSLVLALGIYSAAASLAVVPLFGVPLNAILITMVPLVYVTSISGAIHLSNYYLDATRESSLAEAPGKAVAHAAVPLVLAAVTTAIGLLSLTYSELTPIRLFGVFSAIGVVVGSLAQFLLLPAALAFWTPRPKTQRADAGPDTPEAQSRLAIFPRLGQWVTEHPNFVAAACLVVMFCAAVGLPQVQTSIKMMRLFSPRAPVIPMTQWLEENLGATIPLEVLVRFGSENKSKALTRLRLVAEIDEQLRELPQASGSLSAATFVPPEILDSATPGTVRRAVINAKLKHRYDVLHQSGWLARDGEDEVWRISLRLHGVDDLDYAQFTDTLRSQIDAILDKRLGPDQRGVDFSVTGTAPIVFRARRSLLDGMLFGLGTDIALIVLAVIVTTRSWLTGGVMFLLGVFPTVLVFGAMGLFGIVVDIGSVMTPCVAIGVTVDDIIHFLLCHRQGVAQGLSSPQAANLAYRTCGRAMIQSWGIIGIGLSAFALSSFIPTFRFGMLMLLLLTAGLLGNLLLLPAILAGPIGRWTAKSPLSLAALVHVEGKESDTPSKPVSAPHDAVLNEVEKVAPNLSHSIRSGQHGEPNYGKSDRHP
jgi:predicted RND superfamily exporter protein